MTVGVCQNTGLYLRAELYHMEITSQLHKKTNEQRVKSSTPQLSARHASKICSGERRARLFFCSAASDWAQGWVEVGGGKEKCQGCPEGSYHNTGVRTPWGAEARTLALALMRQTILGSPHWSLGLGRLLSGGPPVLVPPLLLKVLLYRLPLPWRAHFLRRGVWGPCTVSS